MTKLLVKRKVVELRKQGKSYSDILKIIKVSKSSLSLWLKDVPLTNKNLTWLIDEKEQLKHIELR
jgi:transposase